MKDKKIWIAWTNTDRTEGRGTEYPLVITKEKATAIRLGNRGGVQGSNCRVTENLAYFIDGRWYVPAGTIQQPSKEDVARQRIDDNRDAAIRKARLAGLTDAEIKLLQVNEDAK